MFSTGNAKNIVETFANSIPAQEEEHKKVPVQRATQFSTGIKFGRQSQVSFLPVPQEEGPQYLYTPVTLTTEGPKVPVEVELEVKGYMNNVRAETEQERAGGYKVLIACLRVLQEALSGLYTVSHTPAC